MARRVILCMTFGAAVAGLCGCHSANHQAASMGMVSPQGDVLSLGAGDSLGRAVYVNDLILAAATMRAETAFTQVNGDEARWEFESQE